MSRMLPPEFEERLRCDLPQAEAVLAALREGVPSVSVRAVPRKGFVAPATAERVPWCAGGIYLSERPLFAGDAAWHAGNYYVQEASSMSVERVLRAVIEQFMPGRRDLRLLDACAAPGGKSLAAISAMPEGAFLVSNEPEGVRAAALAENIGRFGCADVAVTRADARAFAAMPEAFDIIIADMPCSGEGMMRKEDVAVSQWSTALTERCSALQRSIADSLWRTLRPGGVMIYSTCTFARCEDEDNIRYMIDSYGAGPVNLDLGDFDGVISSAGVAAYRFMPGMVRGEGFFVAALRKPGADVSSPYPRPRRLPKPAASAAEVAARLFPALTDSHIATGSDVFELVPKAHFDLVEALGHLKAPRALRMGLPLGSLRGRDVAPAHEAALATALAADSVPRMDIDAAGAAAYLRGEAVSEVPATLPKGYVLVCHDGMPLGWAKNIGRRANNLYPERSRLKMRLDAMKSIFPL